MSELGGAGRWVVVAALILACTLLAYQRSEAQPSTLYSYDAANHLIQATASTGSAVRYQYDASGHLTAVSALTPTLLNPNAQQNISIGASGQDALLTFNATAGESGALNFGNISTTPANSVITVGVYDGSGSLVGSASSSSNPSLNLN